METLISTNQRITNTLLLNASFINNIGLMHGKMGISIYFYRLARETKNQIYEDYAGELIDEVYEEITNSTPWDFENGLAGIGWGIEYLVQNGFIEADTDEVLEEFDNRIFKELIYNTPTEPSLLNGLLGIGFYLLKRIQNPESSDEKIPVLTNKQSIIHLIDELDRRLTNVEIAKLLNCGTEIKGTKESFDIIWDYPVLIWFLAELYEQNIFNFKVEKLIWRMLEPLSNNNYPKLQSNRLLLALALTKLCNTAETMGIKVILETISKKLLSGIDCKTIKTELPPNNPKVKHGTLGIAWIFKKLFELKSESYFKQEKECWTKQSFLLELEDKGFAGFDFEKENFAFGLLEGLAGVGLFNNTI